MKRVFSTLLVILFVGLVGGTFYFLWTKSRAKPTEFKTEKASVQDITKKTVATGSIVPRNSVDIKPKVTGVLDEIDVVPGAIVKAGDPIGKIKIVPDSVNVNNAQSSVQSAEIALQNSKIELDRNQKLFDQGIIAESVLQTYKTDYAMKRQALDSASSNLQLVKEGATKSSGKDKDSQATVITSTVDGMVIDVPVKKGFSVIQANSFNPGTTVATVADMSDMIFDGNVDESEVGKIQKGMKLQIKIGAIEDQTFDGTLEYIAPEGKEVDGAIQFEIKARLIPKDGIFIRAGYSANADVVLDEKKQVLAIREALVQFDDDKKTYVEVETAPKTFERRDVELGLSDGIEVEVKSGVTADDTIKVPETAGPAGQGSGSGGGPSRGGPRMGGGMGH
jgi:HlyD family secretion protein